MAERLLILRHGEAGAGWPDAERALTEHGRREVARQAAWLAERCDLAGLHLLASPFLRARQTAAIIGEALGAAVETLPIITPDDDPAAVADWLLARPAERPRLLVSHMPLVGALTGLLVEGRADRGLGFSTAAVAELEADVWAAGCARLVGFTTPSDLTPRVR
ncbi:phosphohistidine phosphatase SixA [Halomonas sp. PGE1]|uniref:phosphohistidine phosphatase SixA n=1 Tax=Halomonas sp. PGE1 TaxID=2730360 RepID=UPI001474FA06|nr:phosphohistidine phosphatase SixA [Halomonas sp. PGE1]QJQ99727.1 phosphohistidine phosphatase SixA [Halomonas sp. PGE1]